MPEAKKSRIDQPKGSKFLHAEILGDIGKGEKDLKTAKNQMQVFSRQAKHGIGECLRQMHFTDINSDDHDVDAEWSAKEMFALTFYVSSFRILSDLFVNGYFQKDTTSIGQVRHR